MQQSPFTCVCRLRMCNDWSFVVHRDPRQWGDPSHAKQHSPYLHRHRGASPDKDRAGHSQLVHTPQRTRTGRTPFRQYLHPKFLLEFLVMTTKPRKLSHLHKVKVKNKKSLSMISVYIKVVMTKFPHWLSHHFPLDISPASLHGSSRRGHSSQDVSWGPQWVFWLQSRTLEQPNPGLEDLQPNISNQPITTD